jgi:hypothetical protein
MTRVQLPLVKNFRSLSLFKLYEGDVTSSFNLANFYDFTDLNNCFLEVPFVSEDTLTICKIKMGWQCVQVVVSGVLS